MLILLSLTANAATLDVCATCAYTTVGEAAEAAKSGDTIQVAAGVYDETGLVVNMDLTLVGAGSGVTMLRSDSDPVLYLGSPTNASFSGHHLVVSGLDLQPSSGGGVVVDHVNADFSDIRVAGATGHGIAIYETGGVTVADSTFEALGANAISDGSWYGTLTVTGSSFGGSGISGSDVRVDGCEFVDAGVEATSLESMGNNFFGGRAINVFVDGSSTGDTFTGHTGAIYSGGSFTVEDAVFVGNSATSAAADVYAESTVKIVDSTISGSFGGSVATGGFGEFGQLTLIGVTASDIDGLGTYGCAFSSGGDSYGLSAVDSAFSDIDGSALCSSHSERMTVSRSSFTNVTGTAVSATSADGLDMTVSGCTFDGNGAGVVLSDYVVYTGRTSTLRVSNCTFSGQSDVAVLAFDEVDVDVARCTFSDNADGVYTRGEHYVGTLSISDSSFSGNDTAISAANDVVVEDCTLSDNTTGVLVSGAGVFGDTVVSMHASNTTFSGHTGSAIRASNASLDVDGCVFEGNAAVDAGGAISATSHHGLQLDGNVFSRNSARVGGAIALTSAVKNATLVRNRFCANQADTGGAIWVDASAVTLTGSGNVFADNAGATAGGDLYTQGIAALTNNTFVGGYAPTGGSLWSAADLTFRNNIVAYTSDYGIYGGGGAAAIAYNDFWEVVPDPVGGTWAAPDATNLDVDPEFVSYVAGDCEALDLGLAEGSPLYDAGDPSMTDLDGTVADIGATGGNTPADGTRRWYRDVDGDGHGVLDEVAYGPTEPPGYAGTPDDCDDANADRFPGNPEYCNGADEDCDSSIDDHAIDAASWGQDLDGDGYQGSTTMQECEAPGPDWHEIQGETDCDDADPTVYPGATESCEDAIDQNCDGKLDDGPRARPDADGDGFQYYAMYAEGCPAPEGWAPDGGGPYDCQDDAADVFPGAEDVPGDRIDQDCDGDDAAEAKGCRGCDGNGLPSWTLAVAALAAAGKRRSPGCGRSCGR